MPSEVNFFNLTILPRDVTKAASEESRRIAAAQLKQREKAALELAKQGYAAEEAQEKKRRDSLAFKAGSKASDILGPKLSGKLGLPLPIEVPNVISRQTAALEKVQSELIQPFYGTSPAGELIVSNLSESLSPAVHYILTQLLAKQAISMKSPQMAAAARIHAESDARKEAAATPTPTRRKSILSAAESLVRRKSIAPPIPPTGVPVPDVGDWEFTYKTSKVSGVKDTLASTARVKDVEEFAQAGTEDFKEFKPLKRALNAKKTQMGEHTELKPQAQATETREVRQGSTTPIYIASDDKSTTKAKLEDFLIAVLENHAQQIDVPEDKKLRENLLKLIDTLKAHMAARDDSKIGFGVAADELEKELSGQAIVERQDKPITITEVTVPVTSRYKALAETLTPNITLLGNKLEFHTSNRKKLEQFKIIQHNPFEDIITYINSTGTEQQLIKYPNTDRWYETHTFAGEGDNYYHVYKTSPIDEDGQASNAWDYEIRLLDGTFKDVVEMDGNGKIVYADKVSGEQAAINLNKEEITDEDIAWTNDFNLSQDRLLAHIAKV